MERTGNANLNQRKREIEMKTLPAILLGLMACVAIGVSTARAQVMYTLEDLGVVEKMEASQSAAINNNGDVAGTASKGEETCAFHYDYLKKFMYDAGGFNSRGFGINSTNVVVGDAFFAGPMEPRSHAAIFSGGVAKDIGVLPGQVYSRANSINKRGEVVGFSGLQRDGTESRAFMWSYQTGLIDIGTLGGPYAQAYAINQRGSITGASQTQGMGPMVTTHAFIYQVPETPYRRYSRMVDLGVLGGLSSYGTAINNYNHVAGYSTVTNDATNDERVHAFFHDGTKMIDLGSLGGIDNRWGSDMSVALGINNYDQVVGYTYLQAVGEMPLQQVAFLWRRGLNGGGQMINLNKLLYGIGKNYLVVSATAINDNGQIAGAAYDIRDGSVHAVVLTPTGPYLTR
jgi:probable HAF family extracellular repeat protein